LFPYLHIDINKFVFSLYQQRIKQQDRD